ncbi:S-layer homology domain-containing protein, partial [bacterium 1xD42-67]
KRALSLTLASVMLLGMMVIGTSAASFNDADDISNVTAATILQEIGVMLGDDKGNFGPDLIVTRGQMAIIVCKLLYGDKLNVTQFEGSSQYADVPVGHYANGYVNLASSLGIINGYGNGYFGPSDPVTTAQAALMLGKALGYYQHNELTGDWSQDALTAITLATRLTMFEGIVPPTANEGLTRDNVAVMSFNTLTRATPVRFNTIVNEYYTVGGSLTTGVEYIDAYEFGKPDYTGNEYSHTLGFTIYGLYISEDNDRDDFGRPAEEWSYEKGGVIGSFNKEPIKTYTAKASKGELFNLIGSSNVSKLTTSGEKNVLSVYVDGDDVSTPDKDDYFVRNSSDGGNSGKGVLTEVYQDEDNNVTLVYINTYVMQATDDYSSSKGSVDVTVLTGDATDNALNVDDFAQIVDYAEDDYILYTYADGDVQTVAKADVQAGEVNAYSNATGKDFGDASGSVTIDGTKYDYAKWAEVDADNGCAVTYTVGVDASIVLDKYGYAIYVDDASMSVGNYVYVAAIAEETNLSTKVVAEAYFTDGRDETITVKSIKAANGTDLSDSIVSGNRLESDAVKGWYSYSRNSKGEYTLEKATTTAKLSATSIEQNKVNIAGAVSGNSSTLFIVKDKNDNINLYTGIANVPDITGITRDNSWYLRDGDTAGKPASVVFVDASEGSVKNSTDSLLFLLKKDGTSVDKSDNEEVYTWIVLLEGKEETIKTKQNWTKNTLYENYSIDADGFYEADENDKFIENVGNDDKFATTLTNKLINNSSDALTIGGKTYVTNSDTQINVIMAPTTKGADDLLSGTIMTDNNADYELMLGTTGRALANKFDSDKYCVTGKYYVVYDDEGGSDLITDLYVVIESADEAESSSEDPEPVVIPGGSNTSDITTALTESNDVTVPSPGTLGNVSVGEGKTLTVTGTVPAGTITGEGDVTVSGASVTGDLTFTGVTGEVTLDSVSVTGNTDITVAVDDVKLTGEITLGAKATLKIDGVVTLEEGASIEAAANAKIVIGDGADVSALAGMGLKFYDAEGNEIVLSPAARAAVAALTAGTYVYRVDWDNNGSLETAITGWVLDGNSVATSAIKSLNVAVIDNVEDLIKYTRDWELDNGKEDTAIVKMWVGEGFTAETADRVLKSTPYVMLRWARNDGIDAEAKVSDMTVKCGNTTFDLATNMSWAGTFKEDESDYFHNNWGGTAFLFNTSAADAGADEDAPGVAGVEKAPGTYTVTVTWNYGGDSKKVTATYTVSEATEAE